MERSKRNWALWLAVGLIVVAGAFLASMSGFAERESVSLTATLYSDVIRFEADGVASLRVTVYDLAENELWSSGQVMGDFVDWDRASARGERLANGYYLYLAQGWDGSDALILNKAGKVVLLPGDQVELRAAPIPGVVDDDARIGNWPVTTMGLSDHGIFQDVGIGIDPPQRILHISHDHFPYTHMTNDASGHTGYDGITLGLRDAPNAGYIRLRENWPFQIWTNDTVRLTVAADGFVGIGIDTPGRILHVHQQHFSYTHMTNSASGSSGTDGLSLGLRDAPNAGYIRLRENWPFDIYTNDLQRLRVTADGNVGIGTTNPQTRLDVDGTGRFTGALAVGAYVLPATDGTAGQVLTTNGTGIASWQTVAGGGTGWSLTGNAGTTPGTNFIGTTDNQSLEMKVDNARVMRIDHPNAPTSGPSIVFGHSDNMATPGVRGGTVSGGGYESNTNWVWDNLGTISGGAGNRAGYNLDSDVTGQPYATVGGGFGNRANGGYSTICGGDQNTTSFSSTVSFIGGGASNLIQDGSSYSAILCGLDNLIEVNSDWSSIGGGRDNTIGGTSDKALIGGGSANTIHSTGHHSVIGGGYGNETTSEFATIGGGSENTVTSDYATIAGGYTNVASGLGSFVAGYNNEASGNKAVVAGGVNNVASGDHAAVLGGWSNEASGDFSVALGYNSHATHDGSFVFSDSDGTQVSSSYVNTMKCVFDEGFDFETRSGEYLRLLYYSTKRIDCDNGAYLSSGGTWTNACDVALKQGFEPIDSVAILESVAELPITSWSYKSEDESVIHVGPVAQDFYAAFGLGQDDTSISTIDADGVSLAAIQALYELVQRQQAEIDALEERIADLEATDGE